MPRNRMKPLGTRNNANYSPETLEECLEANKSGELTLRSTETVGRIPRKVGRGKTFSDEEENAFEQHLIALSNYGFPVVETDFRYVVKCYVDKKGVHIDKFKTKPPKL
ncbi:hypothetical protein WA026_022445 [Henosepilachna vigintioctopunctata]|uniref:Uncharacterized protein n=1 Tax=Henosepilachna vigintioctopunctata TaxID=420089 RepID=A0AAW1UBP9_9CUCU